MAVNQLSLISPQHEQQVVFPSGQSLSVEGLLYAIKYFSVVFKDRLVVVVLFSASTEDSFDFADEYFHCERFFDVGVDTVFVGVDDVVL